MKNEIKKRKKRFWAFCLVFVLAIVQTGVGNVFATEYTLNDYAKLVDGSGHTLDTGDIIYKDDTINFKTNGADYYRSVTKTYYDYDGNVITSLSGTNNIVNSETQTLTLTVPAYPDDLTNKDAFKGWKITTIDGSSGYLQNIVFNAVFYKLSNITYVLDGGTNVDANPDTYYEGKEAITLADASKTGYTFEGWYTDASFSADTKVTAITTDMTGDKTLYAKFTKDTYTINYELDGGNNAASNPITYSYMDEEAVLADPSKTGHTFDYWYIDKGGDEIAPITSVPTNQTGDITIYAKFTANTYKINYVVDGKTVTTSNPLGYTYGVGVSSLAPETKTGYTFDGWYSDNTYTTKVTSVPGTKTGDITLYGRFTANSYDINYYLNGGTNAIANPLKYVFGIGVSSFSAASKPGYIFDGWYSDSTFSTAMESISANVTGNINLYAKYTLEPVEETKPIEETTKYIDAPAIPFSLNGILGENGYFTSDVTILPASGFLIATSKNGTYREKINITGTTGSFVVYLKKIDTGEFTSGISVPEIKIDKNAPAIVNASLGSTIYADETEIIIQDENLSQVLVNDEPVSILQGRAVLNLSSNQGEEKYDIVVIDAAGNKVETSITVIASWMETMVIPIGENVKLYTRYSYKLGDGKWTVNGDTTTYSGNSSFYVESEGEYSFSKTE